MTKKLLILAAVVVLALSAIGVMAQDGPGVIDITLPDGSVAPVFTDGRINGFDIGAPLVVYYKAADGTIADPNFASANLPAEFAFDAPLTALNGDTTATTVTSANDSNPLNDGDVVTGLQLLAIDKATANGVPVLEASVEDLFNLVSTNDRTISENGYTLNYSPQSNWFWVSAPADFEGKVYTFAWENTLFQPQQTSQVVAQPSAQASVEASAQATAEPTAQPTAEPTTSP
jgi:hypothetical protein